MTAPIFIVGTMRSGSTLLRLLLDSHPGIAVGQETGFMGAVAATKAIPGWRYGTEWYGRLGWTEEELDRRLHDFYAGMFERHAASQGKQRWGDKTPFHSRYVAEMADIFPEAVFVGIVRHPGAVVASLKRKFHWSVPDAAAYWESTNVEILREGSRLGDDRFALVRYEDMVVDAESTLRQLLHWLGEPWSDQVLRHAEVQAAKGAPRIVDGSTSTRQPIAADRVDQWEQELGPAERRVVETVTGSIADFLGYEAGTSRPPASWDDHPAGAAMLTGTALARRANVRGPDLAPRQQVLPLPEMSTEDLVARLRQAESSLARARSRPVVRFADSVHRWRRRAGLPDLHALLARYTRRPRR